MRTDGAVSACAVASEGGTIPCTAALAGDLRQDFFCALKAGDVDCWWAPGLSADATRNGPVWAAHPPNLVRLAVNMDFGNPGPTFGGVDAQGRGTYWDVSGAVDLGSGIAQVAVAQTGTAVLKTDGTVTYAALGAENGTLFIEALPAGFHYTRIVIDENHLVGLDDAGLVHAGKGSLPSGTFVDLAFARGPLLGLVRSDGAVVTLDPYLAEPPPPTVHAGSFTMVGLDSSGHVCALDRAGALSCWLDATSTAQPFANVPSGSFVQILGSADGFCALRATGTTVCWSDVPIDPPPGW